MAEILLHKKVQNIFSKYAEFFSLDFLASPTNKKFSNFFYICWVCATIIRPLVVANFSSYYQQK
jgi:hypothetical protein